MFSPRNGAKVELSDIEEAYSTMMAEKGASEWVLMGYSKKKKNDLGIGVKGTGREINELTGNFKDDKILFAFAKIESGGSLYGRVTSIFFIIWVGRKVAPVKKRDVGMHKKALSEVITGATFIEVTASSVEEVREANLLQKLYTTRSGPAAPISRSPAATGGRGRESPKQSYPPAIPGIFPSQGRGSRPPVPGRPLPQLPTNNGTPDPIVSPRRAAGVRPVRPAPQAPLGQPADRNPPRPGISVSPNTPPTSAPPSGVARRGVAKASPPPQTRLGVPPNGNATPPRGGIARPPGTRPAPSPHPPRREPTQEDLRNKRPPPAVEKKVVFEEPAKLSWGFGSLQGKRPTMEDRHVALGQFSNHPNIAYFAVYDGHAGQEAADYVGDNLHGELDKALSNVDSKYDGDVKKALTAAVQTIDEDFEAECESNYWYSGTTVTSALYFKEEKKALVMNLGDSRCTIGRGNVAKALSQDHKPTLERERERIYKSGKTVSDDGRIDGTHAFSRAIGDVEMKGNLSLGPGEQAISNVPEYEEVSIGSPDVDVEFLILACDGLWDVATNEEAVQWVYDKFLEGQRDLNVMATELAQHAIDIGSTDNVTCIIVLLPK